MPDLPTTADPAAALDPRTLSLLSPWWIGAAVACLLIVALTSTDRSPIRRFTIGLLATAGWLFAILAGMVGLAVATGFAAVTAKQQIKRGTEHRRHVFIVATVTVLAVETAAWGWATGVLWFAVLTPLAAAAAMIASWVWERARRPELDPCRLFSAADRRRRLAEQGGRCNYADEGCPSTQERGDLFEGDHIIPWSAGGRTVYENLQMLCHTCNHLKAALADSDARRKCHAYWKAHRRTRWFLIFRRA